VKTSAGTLTLKHSGGLLNSNLAVNVDAGTLDLGSNLTIKTLTESLDGTAGTVALNAHTLTVADGSFSGSIDGIGTLVKTSAGTLTLKHSGGLLNSNLAVNVDAGTLDLGSSLTIKTLTESFDGTAGTVALNAHTLTIADGSFSGSIDGTGTLVKTSAGTLTLKHSGGLLNSNLAVNVDAGILDLGSNLTIGMLTESIAGMAGTVNLNANTLTVERGSFSGVISGGGSLVKTLSADPLDNTLILFGANTYTGGTTISGGIVQVSGDGTLGDEAAARTNPNATWLRMAGNATLNIGIGGALTDGVLEIGSLRTNADDGIDTIINLDNGNLQVHQHDDAIYAGYITGFGQLIKDGTAKLTLSKPDLLTHLDNDYTGGTEIRQGTLETDSPQALGLGGVWLKNDLTLVTTPTLSLKQDLTILSLRGTSAADNNQTAIALNGNMLLVVQMDDGIYGGSIGSTGILDITLNGGSLTLSGNNAGMTGTVNIHDNTGDPLVDGKVITTTASALGNGLVSMDGGTISQEANLTVDTLEGSGGTIETNGYMLTIADQDVDHDFSGTITGIGGAVRYEGGTGSLTLSGANDYTGGTTIVAGTLKTNSINALGIGSVVVNGGTLHLDQSLDIKTLTGLAAGTIDLPALCVLTVDQLAPGSYFGNITGAGTLLKKGMQTLTLSRVGGLVDTDLIVNIDEGTLAMGSNLTIDTLTQSVLPGPAGTLDMGANLLTVERGDFSGLISGTGGRLMKNGTGTLVLSANNSYTGGTTIASGTLETNALSALSTGTVTITGGVLNLDQALKIGSLSGIGGDIQLDGLDLTVDQATAGTYAGDISVGGTLVKKGAATLTLNKAGAGLFNSDLIVKMDAGQLALGNNLTIDTLTHSDTASATNSLTSVNIGAYTLTVERGEFQGQLLGTGTLDKIGNPADTLILSGDNTGFTGTVRISGGDLKIGSQNALINATLDIGAPSTLTLQSDTSLKGLTGSGKIYLGTSDLSVKTGNFSGYIDGVATTDQATSGNLIKISDGTAGGGTLILSGANNNYGWTIIRGGTLEARNDTAVNIERLSIENGVFLLGSTPVTINGLAGSTTAMINLAGANVLNIHQYDKTTTFAGRITGTGSISISGNSTSLPGAVPEVVEDDILTLSGASDYTGGTTIADCWVKTINLSALGTGSVIVNSGRLELDAALNIGSLSGAGGIIQIDSRLTVVQTVDGSFSGSITGANVLEKQGVAMLTLTAASDYSGGTVISAGTLHTVNLAALGTGSVSITAGQLKLDTDLNIGSLSGTGGTVDLAVSTLHINQTSSATFAGLLIGNVGGILEKNGAATLTLTSANTYSGGSKITQGSLTITNAAALGTGMVEIDASSHADAVLTINLVADGTVANLITGTGAVVKNGTTSAILNKTNTYSGGTLITAGTLVTDNLKALGIGSVTLAGGTLDLNQNLEIGSLSGTAGMIQLDNLLTITQAVNGMYAGTIVGNGSLLKNGASTLTLNSANSYSGGTTIAVGTLATGNLNALGSGAVAVNGGTLDLNADLNINNLSGTGGTIQLDNKLTVTQNVSGSFAGVLSGNGSLIKNGAASLTLSGASAGYTGTTILNVGTLVTDNVQALGGGAVTVVGGKLDLDKDLNIGTLSGTGGTIQLDKMLTVNQLADGTYAGMVTGVANLVKNGVGTLTLTRANTYEGGTTIAAGTLATNNASSLGSGAVAITGGTLDLNADLNVRNLSGTGGKIQLDNTLTVTQELDDSLSSMIQGSGTLVKVGTAKLTLSGPNTYTGGTQLNAGTLTTMSLSALGAGTVNLAGGTLDLGANLNIGSLSGATGVVAINGFALGIDQTVSSTYAGSITGAGSLTKSGAATLTLSSANAGYSGSTTIANGSLVMGNVGALGLGTISIGTAATLNVNATGTIVNTILGAGSLIKSGATETTLTGTNLYSGGTNVTGGTLFVGSAGALGSGAITVSSATLEFVVPNPDGSASPDSTPDWTMSLGAITNNGVIRKTGDGTMALTSLPAISGTGVFQVRTGELLFLNNNAQMADVTFGHFAVSAGAWLSFNDQAGGTSAKTGLILGSHTISQGNFSFDGADSLLTVNGAVTQNGGILRLVNGAVVDAASSGMYTIYGPNAFLWTDGTAKINNKVTMSNNSSVVIDCSTDAVLDINLTGSASLLKTGAGTLSISSDHNYTGGTTLEGGRILTSSAGAIGTGPVTINTGILELDAALNIGSLSGAGGSIQMDYQLTVNQTVNGAYAGKILGSGALVKTGSATLTLSGANEYSGGTFLQAGTLVTTTASALGSGPVSISGGTLDLNANLGIVSLSGTGGAIQLDNVLTVTQTAVGSYAGTISGAGSLVKAGGSTLTLSGANSYTGGTTISVGTVVTGSLTALGSGPVSISGGTLDLNANLNIGSLSGTAGAILLDNQLTVTQTAAGAFSGTVSGAGSLVKTGSATLTLNGEGTYTGGTTIAAGTLVTRHLSALGSGGVSITGGTLDLNSDLSIGSLSGISGKILLDNVLTVNQTVNGSFAGDITGSGRLEKIGSGTLTLSGASDYSGGTTISAGIVATASEHALGSGQVSLTGIGAKLDLNASLVIGGLVGSAGTVQLDNFTLTIDQDAASSYDGIVTGTGRLVKDGSGTLSLSGTNTYSGGTLIAAGEIKVMSATALGTGSVVLDDGKLILGTNLSVGGISLLANDSTGKVDLNGKILTMTGGTYAAPITGDGKVLVNSSTAIVTLTGASDYTRTTEISAGTVNLGNAAALGNSLVKMTAGTMKLLTAAQVAFSSDTTNKGSVANNGYELGLFADDNVDATTYNAYCGGIISGTGALRKTGKDTVTLAGINTYTGATIIDAGTLVAKNAAALGKGALVVNGGMLDLDAALTVSSLSGLGGSIKMDYALTVNQLTDGIFAGSFTGIGKLTKAGIAKLTLTGTSTYTGGTLIQAGTLETDDVAALGTGAVSITGGVLEVDSDLGIASLSGTAGKIQLNDALTVTQSVTGIFAGTIAGTGGLVKSGSGALTLSGASTYTGGTTLNAGTLFTAKSNSLGIGPLTLNGGILDLNAALTVGGLSGSTGTVKLDTFGLTVNQAVDTEFAGTIIGTGMVVKQGVGRLALNKANSYTGGSTITGGALVVGNAAALGTGKVAVNGGTLELALGVVGESDAAGVMTIGSLSGTGGMIQLSNDSLRLNQTVAGSYAGSISGTGGLTKLGTAALALSGASDYSGGTTLQAGTLTTKNLMALGTGSVAITGGTLAMDASLAIGTLAGTGGSIRVANSTGGAVNLTIDQTVAGAYGGTIVGTNLNSQIIKIGSEKLTLTNVTTSNTYAGKVIVQEGELEVKGNLKTANFTASAGSVLHGWHNARMKQVVIDSSAQFLVERSSGSTSYAVVDSLTLKAGSTWSFKLDSNKTLNLLAVTRSLIVESGVTLHLDMNNIGSATGDYTLVTFGTATGLANLTEDSGTLLKTVGNKLVAAVGTLAPAPAAVPVPTETSTTTTPVATAVPAVASPVVTPPVTTAPVYDSAKLALAISAARMMVNPGVHIEGAERTAVDATHQLNNTVSDRLDRLGSTNVEMAMLGAQKKLQASRIGLLPDRVESDWGAWGSAMGSWGDRETSASSPGYTDSIYGGMVGLDRTFDEFIVGAYGGGFDNKVNGANDSRLDITSAMLGLYGRYDSKDNLWYAVGGLSYGQNDYKARAINNRSSFDGYQYSMYGETGLKLAWDAWYVTPALAVQYTHLDTSEYQLGNVKFDGTNKDSLLGLAIVKGGRWFQTPWGTSGRAELRLAYQNEMMSDDAGSSMSLANMPGVAFTMQNDELARDAIHVGCGVNANITDRWSVGLDYDFEVRNNYTRHSGSLTFRYEF
jgi:autotransporter-associated beta strand protein